MKHNLLTYILTLIIVLLFGLNCKGKELKVTYYYEQTPEFELIRKDTSLLISLQGTIIKIGNEVFISEKRKCYYSVEDYMVYDQYKIDKTIITFYIDPDTSEIIMVTVKTNYLTYYK